ncbi:pyridoxamine 5'-phosphate oxidase family protein [Streptomyces broussonetiae]|uniref:Pyridoxamine 5'-phosphate oxidase family protein n=2 Tax=Streptomyces broussonetiae TaxID=2686304 RepID=A0A6I6NAX8_9ACTN|nr:pyridoxamine 5'-phosphate oxidase family protein [Streptomyces broussonetiae]
MKRRTDRLWSAADAPFDIDEFLRQPLVARVATGHRVIRPVWYLWEDETFWVITGKWSRLADRLQADSAFELVVDTCDIRTGRTLQVIARGCGSVVPFEDAERGRRKLVRYLGPDETLWDDRFALPQPPTDETWWAKLVPDTMWVSDQSFKPSMNGS